jgi:DNA-binding NtrC family response regulator
LGYKEFEISALNYLRISNDIDNIDTLDNIVFNLIKHSDGQKISSEDVVNFLQGFHIKDKESDQENFINMNESIFNQSLKEAREKFETLYFNFHIKKKLSTTDLAKQSGIERTHLYRKLKSLGIKSK